MNVADEDGLIRRAEIAYRKSGQLGQPSSQGSYVKTVRGKQFVVLCNIVGIMAVYEVQKDGSLKGVGELPAGVE